ncbi:hypothetical protein P7K49_008503 [Saguinus oedipus]|uniref:Uncharacterized protein n=1 Tax=Saguinus oedipus TaxID=9490 RepID=A0ABQ9VY00_SAGOE|nr:hypothetical protein P7K49_008503 [Saguinus oedipus]
MTGRPTLLPSTGRKNLKSPSLRVRKGNVRPPRPRDRFPSGDVCGGEQKGRYSAPSVKHGGHLRPFPETPRLGSQKPLHSELRRRRRRPRRPRRRLVSTSQQRGVEKCAPSPHPPKEEPEPEPEPATTSGL